MHRPLNVPEIVKEAQEFEFSPTRSMQAWLRSAKMLLTEAAICEQDGHLQNAYLYLYRHAELVLARLPLHPEYKDPRYRNELAQARKAVQLNLTRLEQWKPRINLESQRYEMAMERRNAEKQRLLDERGGEWSRAGSRRQSLNSDDGGGSETLIADEHRQLAVDLAHREIRRRDAVRHGTRQAGTPPAIIAARRQGVMSTDDWDERSNTGVQQAGRYLHSNAGERSDLQSSRVSHSTHSFNYPDVPSREAAMDWRSPALQPSRNAYDAPPLVPTKYAMYPAESATPALPPKRIETSPDPASSPSKPESSRYMFKPTAFTESGAPLRTVLLPPELRTSFLNLAHPNTSRNLETCGILAATVISNAIFINHLIIPDQDSTSDTCDTTAEGDNALFDYCDAENLLVCGWIHTHPSQSCFLSSRDLHTSAGYQIMLPEAIAIVCAPRQNPDWGIFRLTAPPGLDAVLKCHKSGLFHPHDETNLYTDALRPGHVVEGPGLKFEVVDLRNR